MTDSAKSQAYIAAARTIGDNILSKAITDEHGLTWDFLSQTLELEPSWHKGAPLYSGVTGVALFFLELYQRTNDSKYLDAARGSFDWGIHYYAQPDTFATTAFFTGRLGSSFALLRMAEVTGEHKWADAAIEVAKPALETPQPDPMGRYTDDLLNGLVGTFMGLVYLHGYKQDPIFLDAAEKHLEIIFNDAWPAQRGWYWDRGENNITGLCGFSHGVAGMGFAFLEAGRYLGNHDMYELCRQAFAHETYHFNHEMNAWPDFRKGIFNQKDLEEHTAKLKEGDLDFFTTPKFMDAWCHGAPGIGLARIRAFEYTGETIWREQAQHALDRTKTLVLRKKDARAFSGSHTLCHGTLGDGDIFMEAQRVFGEFDADAEILPQIALEAVNSGAPLWSGYMALEPFHEDVSLFMGTAGIGHAFLRWADPHATPSILAPKMESTFSGKLDAERWPLLAGDINQMRRNLLKGTFGRTIEQIDRVSPGKLDGFLSGLEQGGDLLGEFRDFAKESAAGGDEKLADAHAFEEQRLAIEHGVPSHALIKCRHIVYQQALEEHESEDIKSFTLRIEPEVHLFQTRWNWIGDDTEETEGVNVLLKSLPAEVMETSLSDFTAAVLQSFSEPKKVVDAIEEVTNLFELEAEEERVQVRKLTLDQVGEALRSGLLIHA